MITTVLLISMLGQTATATTAVTGGSCAVQSTSRLDTLLNPVTGGDERFFSRPNGAPNIMLVIDASADAVDWPTPVPTADGCGDPDFGKDYDPGTHYEPPVGKVTATGWPGSTGDYIKEWFKDGKAYILHPDAKDFDSGDDNDLSQDPDQPTGWPLDSTGLPVVGVSAACVLVGTTNADACQTCLNTKGYYHGSFTVGMTTFSATIGTGNFLNYAGPRNVALLAVTTQVVRDVQNVRFGIIASQDWSGPDQWGGSDDWTRVEYFWPSCSKAYDSSGKFSDSDTVNQRNSVLNGLTGNDVTFDDINIASTVLYSAGYSLATRGGTIPAFPSAAGTWPVSNKFEEKSGSNQKAWCDACVYSAIIYLNASKITMDSTYTNSLDLKLTVPSFATSIGGNPASSCDTSYAPSPYVTRCDSKADEIAAWLYRNDFRSDYGGSQGIATYVVNLDSHPTTAELMKSVAKQGGGKYYTSKNATALRAAIVDAITDIQSRGQTFATSAVTTIQTGQIQLTQLVPRMFPQRNDPWLGELHRFAQRNEFVDGTDYNADSDKNDVFVVDGNGDVVVENVEDGTFVKATSFGDLTPTTTPAAPYWEASKRLKTMGWSNRRIWTVVDRSDGRASFTHEDAFVAFTTANWDQLMPTLGLTPGLCPTSSGTGTLLQKLNMSVSDAQAIYTGTGSLQELCAKVVIDYTRGRDLGDEDGDANRGETRDSVMSDIFHSSPVVVEPPPERFICDLGLSPQCARTLYVGALPTTTATPLDVTGSFADPLCELSAGTPVTWNNPYDIYRAKNRGRDKLVIVGSNSGMLHIFNNGKLKTGADAPTCSGIAWSGKWDEGTGDEEYAFIPPDLLPKLQDGIVKGHEYYVDGDVMVRDVWADGSGATAADGQKQWDEFHTMVIGSEGRGGQHYFALELMFPSDTNTSGTLRNPVADSTARPFRWIFPQPGTRTATKMGKAFLTLSPKPPPIGPVLLEDTNAATKITRYGVDTREAWVVMLSGGWEPGMQRGRGVYMVDAFWGVVNGREDNLYWKAELDVAATSDQNAPLAAMSGSFAGPVAMVDYGGNTSQAVQDGFFDTAVVGDTVGQLWVARFFTPGHITNAAVDVVAVASNEAMGTLTTKVPYLTRASPGEVENWKMARAFEMDKYAAVSGEHKDIRNVQPFFYLPSVAIEPATKAMRALIGTGNRYALLEDYSGNCRFDNLMACAKYGCDEVEVKQKILRPPAEIERQGNQWKTREMRTEADDERMKNGSSTLAYCTSKVEAKNEEWKIKKCEQASGPDKDFDDVNKTEFECEDVGSDGYGYHCSVKNWPSSVKLGDLAFSAKGSEVNTNGKDRYFGLWVYGGTRLFTDSIVSVAPFPKTFDSGRLSDRGSSNDYGDLANVTATTCTSTGACSGTVNASSTLGWVYEYDVYGKKTATGSAIVSSCALWSTLAPGTAVVGGTQACTTSLAVSDFFQAEFVTGEPKCAAGFINTAGTAYQRSLTRSVLTPPPEPATVVQVSSTGQIRYSAQLPEPGKGQQLQVDVTLGGDILQSVYELPLSRGSHNCRHTSNGSCVPVP